MHRRTPDCSVNAFTVMEDEIYDTLMALVRNDSSPHGTEVLVNYVNASVLPIIWMLFLLQVLSSPWYSALAEVILTRLIFQYFAKKHSIAPLRKFQFQDRTSVRVIHGISCRASSLASTASTASQVCGSISVIWQPTSLKSRADSMFQIKWTQKRIGVFRRLLPVDANKSLYRICFCQLTILDFANQITTVFSRGLIFFRWLQRINHVWPDKCRYFHRWISPSLLEAFT